MLADSFREHISKAGIQIFGPWDGDFSGSAAGLLHGGCACFSKFGIAFRGALRSAVLGLLACIALSALLQHLRPPPKNFAHRHGAPSPHSQLLQTCIARRAAAAILLSCFVCV
jgi:hypothetical protein